MLADINGNLADLRSEAAMASQRFCLRWNNHQSNLLSVFDQLLHDESFVDVTLAVEGQLLRAHKMVLSACSPYFQALFVNHPDKHPIVILKDVPYVDMRSLLDFMYRGEVSVDQDRLTAFLRVAESLRIKGLTEVHEDKSELPSITSSLLSGSGTGQSSGGAQPPPSLHRINQLSQQPLPQKRYHHMSSHPLLGSALTAPKRKRGRPRKLSGSSDTPMDANLSQEQCIDLVQGSPEMMEMKMGLDFQSEVGFNSSGASAASNGNNNNNNNNKNSCRDAKDDEVTENGTDILDASLLVRIKGEPEPTPSTSHAKEEEFTRPLSRQGSDSFKQDYNLTSTSCGSSTSSNCSVKSEGSERSRNPCTPEKHNRATPSPSSSAQQRQQQQQQNISIEESCSSPNNRSSNVPSSIPSNLLSLSSTTTTSATPTTPTLTTTPTKNSNNRTPNSSPARPALVNASQQQQQQQQNASGTMGAPTGRQVPKRRMRRRATSQSQDPAEQLTEMSVRGLNLFRYASISEGVYQCTECAKVDIQKTFKNKYSFQRHAFLYHEGHQRKVFPCPVCGKEFSRPDKMKNHMKTVHDCFMPKDCVMPFGFYLPP